VAGRFNRALSEPTAIKPTTFPSHWRLIANVWPAITSSTERPVIKNNRVLWVLRQQGSLLDPRANLHAHPIGYRALPTATNSAGGPRTADPFALSIEYYRHYLRSK
jgi:hypothetical protein